MEDLIMVQKSGWIVVLVILSAALLYAAPQMSGDKSSGQKTVTGCLEKGQESQGFFLVTKAGEHWELYPSSGVSLADHVGHTVTVTGTVAHRTEAQEQKTRPTEKQEAGSRAHADLQVSSVKHVSDTCSK